MIEKRSMVRVGVRLAVVSVALTLSWSSSAQVPDRVTIDDLGWLAGSWESAAGDVAMEEIWIEPKGGMMLGLHRDTFSDRPTFFEYLRIEQRGSVVVYVASPRGEAATDFTLVASGPAEAVFENPEHDFPSRIIYRRLENLMTVRIEGEISGETKGRQWEWHLKE